MFNEFNQYLRQKMSDPKIIFESGHNYKILTEGVELALKNEKKVGKGLWLEFGVFEGYTINHIAKINNDQKIFGFDSFVGLPEPWWGCMGIGFFNRDGIFPEVEKNVSLISGWFSNTLPEFIKNCGDDVVSFLHIDSDIYSSAATVLELLSNKIVPGTIIVFDEFYNYPEWVFHEFKAWEEFCEKYKVNYEYVAYAGDGNQQVLIEIL